MDFPGESLIKDPMVDLYYEIEIGAKPEHIWPWLQQFGYHRGGWYIDTWWDKFEQKYFWPLLVPKEARGTYKPAATKILPEYQNISEGDIIPDGPPGSAYYEVVEIVQNQLLLLYATSHFKYVAPQFVYKTRFAPKGAFCWAFIIDEIGRNQSRLASWWQAEGYPKTGFTFIKPFIKLVDGAHQREILKGIKKRVEKKNGNRLITMNTSLSRGSVVAVCKKAEPGLPKLEVNAIQLLENYGVAGDYHAGEFVRHRYLAKKDPTKPNLRQVLLIDTIILTELAIQDIHLESGMMGENIILDGIAVMSLPIGTQLEVGKAVLELTEVRNPCYQLNEMHPSLLTAVETSGTGPDPRNAGMLARILVGGWVHPGDLVITRPIIKTQ